MKKFKYKPRICLNPDCVQQFIPTRSSQYHCCEACRLRKNYVVNKPELDEQRAQKIKIRKTDKALGRLYNYMLSAELDKLPEILFQYEHIDTSLRVTNRMNPNSKRPIHILFHYGFENNLNGYFFIYKFR